MASELTTSFVRTQMAGRIDSTKRASPAQGDGTGLVSNQVKQPKADQVEQAKVETQGKATAQELEKAVADINEFAQSMQRELQFTVEQDTQETIVLVRDKQTDQVIRQVPADYAIKLARTLQESQETGFLIEGRA